MLNEQDIKEQQKRQLFKLLAWVGSQSRLAAQLGVSRHVVHQWVKRGRISATYATIVERKTDGLFKRKDLRPDVATWSEEV